VDDEDVVRAPAATWLRERGYTVIEAEDGPTALRLQQRHAAIDILVTDVGLPGGMNGRQLAEHLRDLRPGLVVLFMTGYAGTALPPGVQVIAKPFTLDQFEHRIAELLPGA